MSPAKANGFTNQKKVERSIRKNRGCVKLCGMISHALLCYYFP